MDMDPLFWFMSWPNRLLAKFAHLWASHSVTERQWTLGAALLSASLSGCQSVSVLCVDWHHAGAFTRMCFPCLKERLIAIAPTLSLR